MRFRSSSHSLKHVDRELKDLINSSENANKCGECGNFYPTWCSVNLGVFLCGRCASVHRKVFGSRDDDAFSNVKSLSMDRWTREDIDGLVSLGGNKGNARFWNPKNVPFPFDGDDDKAIVEHYIRDKYILGKFRYDEIKPEDFGSRMDDFDGESDRFDERNRSRSRSRSHSFYKGGHNRSDYGGSRDSFQSSGSRYSRQLVELKDMGFRDTNKNLDALSSAHGNINRAIDYLEKSSSSRNSVSAAATTSTPPLPRRRATTSGPQPAIFDGTNVITPDFTSNSASFVQAKPAVFDGTLQQYYDPATGMIYAEVNSRTPHFITFKLSTKAIFYPF
ncbi:CLL_collapsed_G0018130.mRNA.1.CDS.1 [Saccharomyces cerevisiae]|nr:CLL_HP1_G0017850.mRNA.1.CDS.1 [Saccharomyces cerevisiae]CAI7306923.1 CLL_collapsed_G0018130.mRNA.1.CDS.1 [Saccharomyces cerevisiae]